MWKESKQLQLLDYDGLSRSALYITLETEMKAQSNECRSGQKIVFNEQQLKITIKTLEKCVKCFSVGTGPQPVTIQYLQAQ